MEFTIFFFLGRESISLPACYVFEPDGAFFNYYYEIENNCNLKWKTMFSSEHSAVVL